MDSTEAKSQETTIAENRKLQRINHVLIQLERKNHRKQQVKKDLNHRQINQDQEHKLKQKGQEIKIVKKGHYYYPVQMVSNCEKLIQGK